MISKKILRISSLSILLAVFTTFTAMQPAFAKENFKAATKDLKTGVESTIQISSLHKNSKDEDIDTYSTTSSAARVSSIAVNTVFGNDDRTQVTDTTSKPYSAICYLESTFPDGFTQRGTAWIYKGDTAGTAGHCIYNAKHGGWPTNVTLWPGRNDSNAPYGSVSSKSLTVSSQWNSSSDSNYDWGVIKLNSDIADQCGSISSIATGPYQISPGRYLMTLAGYPSDRLKEMYQSNGYITSYDNYRLSYQIDMKPGDSGAPLFFESKTGSGKKYWSVVGINTTESDSTNHAVRATDDLRDTLDNVYEN